MSFNYSLQPAYEVAPGDAFVLKPKRTKTIGQILAGGHGRPSPPPAPTESQPPAAAPPPTTPAVVQTILNSIPIARDGDVISPDFHNSLRSAVVALAEATTNVAISTEPAVGLVPDFRPVGAANPWAMDQPPFLIATGGRVTAGWMIAELPDGVLIRSVNVTGFAKKKGSANKLSVKLLRRSRTEASAEPIQLCEVKPGQDLQDKFDATATVAVAGADDIARDRYATVDNDQFVYFVRAEADLSADGEMALEFRALEISYRI